MTVDIEILFFRGCPNHRSAVELAKSVAHDLAPETSVRQVEVQTADQAKRQQFLGSPSVRVNGRDIEPDARSRTDFALSCRIYGDSGVPPRPLLEAAIREALPTQRKLNPNSEARP